MKKLYTLLLFASQLLIISTVFAQFEPQKGILKGSFNSKEFSGFSINSNTSLRKSNQNDVEWLKDNKLAVFILGYYKITYGFWTLLGEPIFEYKFYWEYNKDYCFHHIYNGIEHTINISSLNKYPDLAKKLKYITPLPDIKINVTLEFWPDSVVNTSEGGVGGGFASRLLASCKHQIDIDLASPSGVKDNFSLPGSDDWDKTFTHVHFFNVWGDDSCWFNKSKYPDGLLNTKNKDEYAAAMNKLFKKTRKITIIDFYDQTNTEPQIVDIRWNSSEIKDILDDYCSRITPTTGTTQSATTAVKKNNDDDFWNSTASTTTTTTTSTTTKSDDDFWNTTSTPTATTNTTNTTTPQKLASDDDFWNTSTVTSEELTTKLDKAEVLYAAKNWKEARTLYKDVATADPNISYAKNKVVFIDSLLAYKPKFEENFIAIMSTTSPYYYGFKDSLGNIVIDYKYKSAMNFSDGLAAVSVDNYIFSRDRYYEFNTDNTWSFIDQNGNQIIPPKFSDIEEPFKNGQAKVSVFLRRSGDTYYYNTGVIDINGQWVGTPIEKSYLQHDFPQIFLIGEKY